MLNQTISIESFIVEKHIVTRFLRLLEANPELEIEEIVWNEYWGNDGGEHAGEPEIPYVEALKTLRQGWRDGVIYLDDETYTYDEDVELFHDPHSDPTCPTFMPMTCDYTPTPPSVSLSYGL